MTDLIEFLRARLDDDEQGALAASERDWRPDGAKSCQVYVLREDGSNRTIAWCQNGYEDDFANSLHVARHDPARVLREVEAKRKVIERHELAAAVHPSLVSFTRGQDDGYRQACLDAIRDAAAVYTDHPDYRDEWRP